ncbi:CCA tRNA nucleotidyltransferase [Candidatus Nanohalovita haloferacivicina]|uniref:CCA tRNA nucleotidyltransferase n=1 Tax=Candidatus Nanohalovita haloferacivicina TaxID=2978046 RepID=UPI00325FB3A2|nr:tRNA nucleotidyltransferase (CCA-adding enzyme) [Candidatus Nanohalobia archaeon BNXNv]
MNWERLREKVLEEIYPTEEEFEKIQGLYDKISEYIEEEYGLETHFAGSAGRKTCMAGDKDIDLFVLFPETTERIELENKGLEIGKKTFQNFNADYHVEYAEHPYSKGHIEGVEVEIVPCFDTSPEDIRSAVDRTPHHSRWARENLDEEQKKDAVLLKKFLKKRGLYGSSLKNRGFSGYLCEILVAEYGSFRELIEDVEDWTQEKVLDLENYHEEGLPQELKNKFSNDNLVVIDPVDPERNVASVLSTQNYAEFIHQAWRFNKKPGIDFFREEDPEYERFELEKEIKDRGDFLVIEFDSPDEVDDVVYPQMRKTLSRMESVLTKNDFRLFESGFHVGEENTRIFFELSQHLPAIEELKGPRVFHGKDHMEQFTSKYENTFVQGDRLIAKTEREYTDARTLLKEFVSRDREKLKEEGVPNYVAEKMEEAVFTEPVLEDDKWLNYLAEKLHVIHK